MALFSFFENSVGHQTPLKSGLIYLCGIKDMAGNNKRSIFLQPHNHATFL
jgi:hypothetical protein